MEEYIQDSQSIKDFTLGREPGIVDFTGRENVKSAPENWQN